MMCFSIEWLVHLLILLVLIAGAVAILKIWVFPFIASNLGDAGGRITATINVVLWVIVCILVIYVVASLLMCALSGIGYPRLR